MKSTSPGLIRPSSRRACFFDGGGVFAQAARGLAQLGVFGARAFERSFERGIFAAGFEQREQAFFAGDGVDDDDERDEEEDVTEQSPAAAGERRLRRRRRASAAGCGCVALGHGLGVLARAGRSGSLSRR